MRKLFFVLGFSWNREGRKRVPGGHEIQHHLSQTRCISTTVPPKMTSLRILPKRDFRRTSFLEDNLQSGALFV